MKIEHLVNVQLQHTHTPRTDFFFFTLVQMLSQGLAAAAVKIKKKILLLHNTLPSVPAV